MCRFSYNKCAAIAVVRFSPLLFGGGLFRGLFLLPITGLSQKEWRRQFIIIQHTLRGVNSAGFLAERANSFIIFHNFKNRSFFEL